MPPGHRVEGGRTFFMKFWSGRMVARHASAASLRDTAAVEARKAAREAAPWSPGPADVAVAAGLLALTLGAAIPLALHYHRETQAVDRERILATGRIRILRATERRVQSRRLAVAELRR